MSTVEFDAPESLEATAMVASEIEAADLPPVPDDGLAGGSEDEDATAQGVSPDGPQPLPVDHMPMSDDEDYEDDDDQDDASEDSDLLAEIFNASLECRRLEAMVELKKEEVKETKSQYEQAVIRLRNVCSEIGNQRSPRRGKEKLSRESGQVVAQPVVAADAANDPVESTTVAGDESWRSVSLNEILQEKIKGFGQKKQEALLDLCPTLGDFEDLRSRVGKDAAELHELLPDGIGLETASVIEERHLDWIAKNCHGASVKSDQVLIAERAKQLVGGSDTCLDSKHPEGRNWYESGWSAYGREVRLDECPYIPGPEQDDWIRGWLGHQLADQIPDDSQDANSRQEVPAKPAVSVDEI